MLLWHTLATYFRRKYGVRVQKIPLDAGATCPNRDGTLSARGCIFCNDSGSGSGMGLRGLDLRAQWDAWYTKYTTTDSDRLFMAYLQSFSNTYGPASRLAAMLEIFRTLPDLAGVSVGTRPDCLDPEKMAILGAAPWKEKWLELGVQTLNDATLRRINRGHDAAASAKAIELAEKTDVQVCAHLMLGLPGETPDDVHATVRRLNALPVHGVKLHNVYVCRNTALERAYRAGEYVPLTEDAYVELAVDALTELRPDIIIHRVVADPAPGELVAPDWATRKGDLVRFIQHAYHRRCGGA